MLLSVARKQQTADFITLNDVLVYINNATQIEKRSIQIAVNTRMRIHAVNPERVKPSGTKQSYFWKFKYYLLRSFRITSLSIENIEKARKICDVCNYNVMDVQFVRVTFDYFEMQYNGEKTYYGYFISTNEID